MSTSFEVPVEGVDLPERPWLEHYPAGVPAHLDIPNEALPWLLERAAEQYPDRVACHYYAQTLTYSELLAQSRQLAAALIREGVQPGDRVGVLLPNVPEYLVSIFGVWMAGGIVVALSPMGVAEHVAGLVHTTGCRIVIALDVLTPLVCHGEHHPETVLVTTLGDRLPRLEQLGYAWVRFQRIGFRGPCPGLRVIPFKDALRFDPEAVVAHVAVCSQDPAYILPTGGTTGAPRAVTLSHHNLVAQSLQLMHWSQRQPGEETILAVLPFFHSYGLSVCGLMGIALGATLVMHHRFRPSSVARLIEKHRPTIFPVVPAALKALNTQILRYKRHDFSSIKTCICGGAPLPVAVAKEFTDRTGVMVVEGYGLSEASPVTHVGPLDGTWEPGTIGYPLPDTDARIVDAATGLETLPPGEVGELAIRGPQVMLGYWNNREETTRVLRDGWLFTGDLASCDENGLFRIVDRKKDLVITSGFNVYPADVEEVLRGYHGVKDVAVVGVPDDDVGELVKAVLVLESGIRFSRKDFDEYARNHLAVQQRPKIVETRTDDLPRNFLGKVLRRELRGRTQPDQSALNARSS